MGIFFFETCDYVSATSCMRTGRSYIKSFLYVKANIVERENCKRNTKVYTASHQIKMFTGTLKNGKRARINGECQGTN